jgi:glycosyltransferase involved in cell wall biosynthesis
MRVAIVHYWLVGMRGGERVLEALCEMFPEADVFTHVHVPGAISPTIERHQIKTTFVSKLPRPARFYKSYLPLMPMALEQLDLRGYDLIISSESGPAKGIIPPAGALHLCYCHSPMRYVWNMLHDYQEGTSRLGRFMMSPLLHYVRFCDVAAATRVDAFAANSRTVAKRINSYWRRTADVIFPPVDVESFKPVTTQELGDFHLMAGELVRYKRPDLAVEAFSRSGRRLIVVGGGEMLPELRAKAGPTVTLLGPQSFDNLRDYYARCTALIFPGEEDFGIVPVEAMASGRPVVAFGKGGATETVVDGVTGTFFEEQTVESLLDAVERCDKADLDPDAAIARSRVFGKDVFKASMADFVQRSLAGAAA